MRLAWAWRLFRPSHGYDAAFRLYRAEDNLKRLQLLTQIFTLLIVWFAIVTSITGVVHGNGFGTLVERLWKWYIAYGFILLVSVVSFIYLHVTRFGRPLQPGSERIAEGIVIGYATVVMILGSVISVLDRLHFHHLMVSMLVTLMFVSFVRLEPRQFLVPFFASSAVLLLGLALFEVSFTRLLNAYNNYLLFVPILYIISRVLYESYYDGYANTVLLNEEMAENKRLNELLTVANTRLEQLASADELTRIANRRGLYTYLQQYPFTPNGTDFGVIIMDIDLFKKYNDHYGHTAGDDVLRRVAKALQYVVGGEGGFTARWGGEEFVYVAPGMDKKRIMNVSQIIHEAISSLKIKHNASSVSPYVTISQGVSSFRAFGADDVITGLNRADNALYEAKQNGRNGQVYVPPSA